MVNRSKKLAMAAQASVVNSAHVEEVAMPMSIEVNEPDESIMPWSNVTVDDAVLTLWPGTAVTKSALEGPDGLKAFFKTIFDIEVTPVGCVETLPDTDEHGKKIEGTGGRYDFFFFVKFEDVPKFAVKRFQFGMRWWEDIYFNNDESIYPIEFRSAYPDKSQLAADEMDRWGAAE